MSAPRAGRVIRAYAVCCDDGVPHGGTYCPPTFDRFIATRERNEYDDRYSDPVYPCGPHTVILLTGTWEPPAKAEKGKR